MKTRPVPLEEQWRLWPRIARPFECRSCGQQYACAFDPEIESKARQFMREGTPGDALPPGHPFAGLGAPTRVHDRVPRFRYCRNDDCDRFFDYELEAKLRERVGRAWPNSPRLPMRKWWRPMPEAANGPPVVG